MSDFGEFVSNSIGPSAGKSNKKPKRDPNIPVLSFTFGSVHHEIFVAGKGEFVKHTDKRSWGPNSIVHRRSDGFGVSDVEYDLHSGKFWCWVGWLVKNGKTDEIEILTKIANG